jgi:CubicO group peptidase (beta-lactamase class C family)
LASWRLGGFLSERRILPAVRTHAAVLAASLLVTGCTVHAAAPTTPAPPVPARGPLGATRPAVTSFLEAEAQKHKLPGLSLAVVDREGLVYFVGLGARDTAGAPVTVDSVFRIGSITKTFTGMALLALRDAGKLGLDEPVSKYVPELASARAPTSDSGPITIRHLVTHSSGIPRLGRLDYGDSHEVTRVELRDAARDVQLEFAPGTKAVYSNLAMALAGPVIARASGEPYRQFVQGHVLAPLGMRSTVWDAEAVAPGMLAQGWIVKGDGFAPCGAHWRLGAAEAMGGLYSSAEDLSRYVAFQLSAWPPRDGADAGPLRRSSVRESQLVAGFARAGGQAFGVNWIIKNEPRLGYVVFHNGGTEGYHASLWMLPERGVGVIALGPASDVLDGMSHRVLEMILDQTVPALPPVVIGGPARAALARVRALMAAPDRAAIEKGFAPEFLAAVPPDQVVTFFQNVASGAGACTAQKVVKAASPTGAEVELTCEHGGVLVTLEADPAPPHLIRALKLTPR